MQDAQPELKRIQKQYKDNKEEMNKKVAEYYKENGINPVGALSPTGSNAVWFALLGFKRAFYLYQKRLRFIQHLEIL